MSLETPFSSLYSSIYPDAQQSDLEGCYKDLINLMREKAITEEEITKKEQNILNLLEKRHPDFNVNSLHGKIKDHTLLMIACEEGLLETVKILISLGADHRKRKKNRKTALLCAVRSNNEKRYAIVEYLLGIGGDPNTKTHSGDCATYAAIEIKDEKMIRILLAGGADLEMMTYEKSAKPKITFIAFAKTLFSGDKDFIAFLDATMLREDYKTNTYLKNNIAQKSSHSAPSKTDSDTKKHNKKKKKTENDAPDTENFEPASKKPRTEFPLQKLSALNSGINESSTTDIGSPTIEPLPEKHTVSNFIFRVNDNETYNLIDAIEKNNDVESVLSKIDFFYLSGTLNKNNIDSLCNQQTLLMAAVKHGKIPIAKKLFELGADINLQNVFGISALHLAGAHGHKDILQWLLNLKANPNIETTYGSTPLFLAVLNNHFEAVKILIVGGAIIDLDKKHSKDKLTLLDVANNSFVKTYLTQMASFARSTTISNSSRETIPSQSLTSSQVFYRDVTGTNHPYFFAPPPSLPRVTARNTPPVIPIMPVPVMSLQPIQPGPSNEKVDTTVKKIM